MRTYRTPSTDRIAIALPEARLEHGLSQRQLAHLSGVSRDTIRKVEEGGQVAPWLLLRLGAVFVILDAFAPPRFEDGLADLLRVVDGKGVEA